MTGHIDSCIDRTMSYTTVRITKKSRDRASQLAADLDCSILEVVERGIDLVRTSHGAAPEVKLQVLIDGRPLEMVGGWDYVELSPDEAMQPGSVEVGEVEASGASDPCTCLHPDPEHAEGCPAGRQNEVDA